jgi:hypothetical protein
VKLKQECKKIKSPFRRSKRTTPSLYRKDGGQENLALTIVHKTMVKNDSTSYALEL